MITRKAPKLISLLLSLMLVITLLSGCADTSDNGDDTANTDDPVSQDNVGVGGEQTGDLRFTLRYTDNDTLNPMKCSNPYNCSITSLMFENLFVVDTFFNAEPVLCSEYSVTSGKIYNLVIRTDVTFNDGSPLTLEDVVYSINLATQSKKFSGRLSNIKSVSVEEDGKSVKVVLHEADYTLPKLLDIPVIKKGSGGDVAPIGTGLYIFSKTDGVATLSLYPGHRNAANSTCPVIYLEETSLSDMETSFSNYSVDALLYDPLERENFNLRTDYEARYYSTTMLQYLGFNMSSSAVSNPEMRRAISHAVNRDYIVKDVMNNRALAAPTIINSSAQFYNSAWNNLSYFSPQQISSIFISLSMQDFNGDGFLDFRSNSTYSSFSIDFIVNEENSAKVEAAKDIALQLKNVGININLRVLPWDDYLEALQTGNFDMYYAETTLSSNFDISEILLPGGSLNFGLVNDAKYKEYLDAYFAASEKSEMLTALDTLCSYIYEKSHIIPVVFRQNAVITHRGEVAALKPTQSNLFYNPDGLEITPR